MNKTLRYIFIAFLAALIVFRLIYMWIAAPLSYCGGDMAEYLNAAYRTCIGDIPYRDFWLLFPPLEVYLPSAILHITGSAHTIYFADFLIRVVNAISIFLLFNQLKRRSVQTLLAISLVFIWGGSYFYLSLCLLSAVILYRYLTNRKIGLLIISALLCALSFGFRFYQTLPLCLASIIILFIEHKNINKYSWFIFLFLSSILPLLLLFIIFKSPSLAIQSCVVDAFRHGTAYHIPYWHELKNIILQTQQYAINIHQNQASYTLIGLFFLVISFIPVLIAYCIPLFIIKLLLFKSNLFYFPQARHLLLWAALFIPYAWRFSNMDHIYVAYTPFLLLFVIILPSCFKQFKTLQNLRTIIILSAIVYLSTDSYNLYKSFPSKKYSLKTEMLSVISADKQYIEQITEIMKQTAIYSKSNNDVIFMTWGLPPMYMLCKKNNPCYYDSPMDFILNPDESKELNLISQIKKADINLIILEEGNMTGLNNNHKINNMMPLFYNYVQQTYELKYRYGPYTIFIKEVN
jgi:hypothetical protein